MAIARIKLPKQVGRYQLVYELSPSYLGPFWAARIDGGDGSGLAMLRLVSLARLDADTRVRLLEAAWQAMEVRDDRVISVTDVVASDGELSVVSDYVEGLPLRSIAGLASVRRRPIPVAIALRFIIDLTDGVVALHRAMAELGDEAVPLVGGLSADSVLIGADGRTSVMDVAIASAASSVESLGGSPERVAYAAPEQVGADGPVDARTDVFSLGALAWEMLSSRRLFVGSDKGVVQKVLAAKIPRLDENTRKGDQEIPKGVIAAVMKALAREPGARFESVEAFRAALAVFTPASPAEAAEYVTTLAEGALARTREALSLPPRPRPAAPAAIVVKPEPKPGPRAVIDPKLIAGPRVSADTKPQSPARVNISPKPVTALRPNTEPRALPTARGIPEPRTEAAAPKASPGARAEPPPPRSDVGAAPIAASPRVNIDAKAGATNPVSDPKPGGGWRALETPQAAKAAQGPKTRPRQVTMIGLPPPADLRGEAASPPPAPATAVAAESPLSMDPTPVAPEPGGPTPNATWAAVEPPVVPPEPSPPAPVISREPAMFPESLPPPSSSDEPTAQYSREHLQQLAAAQPPKPSSPPPPPVELPRLVSMRPTPRPLSEIHTERPPPPEPEPDQQATLAPPDPVRAMPQPVPETAGVALAAAPNAPDGRAAAPLPPARIDAAPVRVAAAPPAARIDASVPVRLTERPPFSRPPPATPQASYLPSQIAPPLIRDPRANRAAARSSRGAGHFTRGIVLGVLVSLVLVGVSTAVALYFMRERSVSPADANRAPAAAEQQAATPVTAATVAAAPAEPSAIAPAPATPSAVASAAGETPATSATVAPVATVAVAETHLTPSAQGSAPEPSLPAPSTTAAPRATAHAPAAHAPTPAPRAAPKAPAKKKPRFVPADI